MTDAEMFEIVAKLDHQQWINVCRSLLARGPIDGMDREAVVAVVMAAEMAQARSEVEARAAWGVGVGGDPAWMRSFDLVFGEGAGRAFAADAWHRLRTTAGRTASDATMPIGIGAVPR